MKAFKKAVMACMAVGALSAIVATSAFAATVSDDKTKVSADTSMTDKEGQMTVLVIKKGADDDGIQADDILYIDQQAAADGIFQNMGVKGGALADGDYVLKIGGENLDEIIVEEFTVGGSTPEYTLGDVDASGMINETDAGVILDYCVELTTLTDTQKLAADIDKNGMVNETDAGDILDYCVELPSIVGGTK